MSALRHGPGVVSRRGLLRAAAENGLEGLSTFAREAAQLSALGRGVVVLGHELAEVAVAGTPLRVAYWVSRTPVTNSQYARCIRDSDPSLAPPNWNDGAYPIGQAARPVVNVSGAEAKSYCAWLNAHSRGWRFRLPTAAEWEHAASTAQPGVWEWTSTPVDARLRLAVVCGEASRERGAGGAGSRVFDERFGDVGFRVCASRR